MLRAAAILRASDRKFEKTGYDNWNGGTDLYTLYLGIGPDEFARLGADREACEEQIAGRLKLVLDPISTDFVSVQICPKLSLDPDWKKDHSRITAVTRRDIADYFIVSGVSWSGDMDEADFLNRIYNMPQIPSTDGRFKTAAQDIWQHRYNNDDWPSNWVFTDQRFGILESDEKLLRFLAESLHPVVRKDRGEVAALCKELNKLLRPDGWELVEAERISDRPCFAAQRIHSGAVRAVTRAKVVADALNAAWMRGEIIRVERAIETDPSLAVGTAKDLVETCCKTILTNRKVEIPKGADLPKIVKLVATELKLVPDGISDAARGAEVIRGILRNLATLTQGLSELRGLYGSGHGRDGKHRGLGPRHARLAVASAVAFIDFVTDTYHEREASP